jgi:hypothetical protein
VAMGKAFSGTRRSTSWAFRPCCREPRVSTVDAVDRTIAWFDELGSDDVAVAGGKGVQRWRYSSLAIGGVNG